MQLSQASIRPSRSPGVQCSIDISNQLHDNYTAQRAADCIAISSALIGQRDSASTGVHPVIEGPSLRHLGCITNRSGPYKNLVHPAVDLTP